MEKYWEDVMRESLATIKWITGCDCKNDIREIEEVIARHKKKPGTTWQEAERLDTAKAGWLWAHHEKVAHEAAATK